MLKISGGLATLGLVLLVLSTIATSSPGPIPTAALGAAGAEATVPAAPSAARGRALFRAKGCADCHLHAEVVASGRVPVGPSLTNYRNDPAVLRRWLTDPAAVKPGTRMPALGLSETEIADLIAFLNAAP